MEPGDQNGVNRLSYAPASERRAPAYLSVLVIVGLALAAVALVLGLPMTVLLLAPAKDAGVQGHSYGVAYPSPGGPFAPYALLLPAIGISMLALVLARRGERKLLRQAWWAFAFAVVALSLQAAAGVYVGRAIRRYASGGGGNPPCVPSLNRLGMSMQLYADDHDGWLPDNLGELVKVAEFPRARLVCTWVDDPEQEPMVDGVRTSFVYLGKGLREPVAPRAIVMYERPGIHDPKGTHVLFGDGHIEWLTNLRYELEQQRQSGTSRPAGTGMAEGQSASRPVR